MDIFLTPSKGSELCCSDSRKVLKIMQDPTSVGHVKRLVKDSS